MMKRLLWIFWMIPTLFFHLSCDDNTKPPFQQELMVFGYLWGNEPLSREHAIFVTYSRPLFEEYDLDSAAISGAWVQITEESSGNSWMLVEDSTRKGFYFNNDLLVRPGEQYHLEVRADGKVVRASTRVPSDLTIRTALDSVSFPEVAPDQIAGQFPIYLRTEDRDQLIMVDVYCLEPWFMAEYISPFGSRKTPGSPEEYDGGNDGPPRHIFAVAPIREFDYTEEDSMAILDWYSSMIIFYGGYRIMVAAIDENYNRYLSSEYPVYNGGIQGGLGVFASMVGKRYRMRVIRK